jgi:hypothetical protein
MKIKLLPILFVSALCVQVQAQDITAQPQVIGEASDLKTKELRYREYHYYSDTGLEHRVIYKEPSGETIADKSLNYNSGLSEPTVEQQNTLCGEYFQVRPTENNKRLQISYRAEEGNRTREKTINRPDDVVIDAGFNHYVRQKWDDLVSGKTVEFSYLAPSRLRTYSFKAEAVRCEGDKDSTSCFIIAPDVWYLNIALDPIVLTYDNSSRELISFAGLGNIADKKCDYMAVNIHYTYPVN